MWRPPSDNSSKARIQRPGCVEAAPEQFRWELSSGSHRIRPLYGAPAYYFLVVRRGFDRAPLFPFFRLAAIVVSVAIAAPGTSIAARIAASANRPCCKLWRLQCAFSFALVPFEIRTNVSSILVLMAPDGNTRFHLLTACPHRKVVSGRDRGQKVRYENGRMENAKDGCQGRDERYQHPLRFAR